MLEAKKKPCLFGGQGLQSQGNGQVFKLEREGPSLGLSIEPSLRGLSRQRPTVEAIPVQGRLDSPPRTDTRRTWRRRYQKPVAKASARRFGKGWKLEKHLGQA